MMRVSGRIGVLLLCLCMVFTMMPAAAFAGETTESGSGTDKNVTYSFVNIGGNILTDSEETTEIMFANGKAVWEPADAVLTLENADLASNVWISTEDGSATVTVILKGANTITIEDDENSGSALGTTCNLVIQAEEDASLAVEAGRFYNAIYNEGSIEISGGELHLKSGNPALFGCVQTTVTDCSLTAESVNDCAIYEKGQINILGNHTAVHAMGYWCALRGNSGIAISGGSVTAESLNDSAIYSPGQINISGEGTTVRATGVCAMHGVGGVAVSGATVIGHSTAGNIIYTNGGNLVLDSAEVTLTSDYDQATGLFMDYKDGTLSMDGSVVTIDSSLTSVFSQNDITVTDSKLDLTSGGNGINAWGNLEISGMQTEIISKSKFPIAGGLVAITGGSVNSTTTDGTAISGDLGITISGGSVCARTSAQMSSIYAGVGDIRIEGQDTSVEAVSEKDGAVFARDGRIILNAGNIKATAADGFPAFVARNSNETDNTQEPEIWIELGEWYSAGDNIAVPTVWKEDDNGNYYSSTVLAPSGTVGPLQDISGTPSQITVVLKEADYTAVDAAIAEANELDKTAYKDFSAVEAAIHAVVRGKKITEQAEVDDMAGAIRKAIEELEEKEIPVVGTVDAPSSDVEAGTYTANQLVQLSTNTEEAEIYYTTDEMVPSRTNGTKYTGAITVAGEEGKSVTTTIRAIAVKDGMYDSQVKTFVFVIQIPKNEPPVTPGQPDNPGTPGTPNQPGNPGTPVTPSQPDNPGMPITPGQPDNPGTPVTPGQPDNPSMPNEPDPVKVGTIFKDSKGNVYKVTANSRVKKTVEYIRPKKGTKGAVSIPDTITINKVTYKVTSIARNAFKNNKKITKVKMGSNILTIGANAFYGCSKLTGVTIGKNVTAIGNQAFYKCSRLAKVTIPAKVKKIGGKAFYGCKKLKNITFKTKKLTKKSVGARAFQGIYKKAVIKAPKEKLKAYRTVLKRCGISSGVKFKT